MNRNHFSKLVSSAAFAATLALASTQSALAVPVTGVYNEDARCDVIPSQTLTHELGQAGFFPINEAVQIGFSAATFPVCVADDGIANDWTIQISNISGIAWTNLFFVADLGMTIGNADGNMIDVINAPGVTTDAFRIDGTVTPGLNNNLINESGVVDEILSPGETWRFVVTNFAAGPGNPPFPPIIQTPGFFAGSSPIVIPPNNTASILANPVVPEPGSFSLLLIAGGALLMHRRPRRA